MNLVKALVITGLLSIGIVSQVPGISPAGGDCDQYKIEIKSTETSNGESNGKVEILFDKDPQEFSSFLFSGKDNQNQLEVKEKHIDHLAAGTYNLYVKIGKACVKHFTVEIK